MGAATVLAVGLSGAVKAQTSAATYTIGVDAAAPPGHNWEYINFFPNTGVNVHNGDVLHFSWGAGISPDAFHTATLLPASETPQQAWHASPLVVPAPGGPSGTLIQNSAVFNPTNPLPGSGPGSCGDAKTPCAFDGTAELSSGGNGSASDFYVKLDLPSGTTGPYSVVDLLDPGMEATINVVADSAATSTQSELDSAAAAQLQHDSSEALAAETAAVSMRTTNPDGTHLITAFAGLSTPDVQVAEMLPKDVVIQPGDQVKWVVGSLDTVTFPSGTNAPQVNPFPGTNGFNPAPYGPTAIRNGGYRTTSSDGEVFDFGHATAYGAAAQSHPTAPIVALLSSADGQGYWQVGADGSVYSFGDARFTGAATGKVTAPIVSMIVDPRGYGYLLVGQDGNTYVFDPRYPPPLPGRITPANLAAPIAEAVAAGGENTGPGFWSVGADGGVFAYGSAAFFGSAAGLHLAKPIVGIAGTGDGGGYWLVASDGGVFSFGDAKYFGSLGATRLNAPIVGIVPTPDGGGYYLLAADGGVFTFGDAVFAGSAGGSTPTAPMTAIQAVPGTVASSGVLSRPPLVPGLASSYTFTFPERGTFGYFSEIDPHEVGVITVS